MEYMRKHCVFVVVEQRLQFSHAKVGGQDERVTCAVRGWSVGTSRRPRTKMNSLDQKKSALSPARPSEGLKTLVSTMMTGHDDHTDGPIEMATWDVSRAHLYSDACRWIRTYLPEGYELKGRLARPCPSRYGT